MIQSFFFRKSVSGVCGLWDAQFILLHMKTLLLFLLYFPLVVLQKNADAFAHVNTNIGDVCEKKVEIFFYLSCRNETLNVFKYWPIKF